MKKLLSIVLLFSCLLEATPWNTMQPCIASTITPSEQIVESDNSSISTENSLVSYYDVYGEVYKQEPISVTSSSITLPIYTGRQEYYLANFVGWVYGTKPVNVYPGDTLSNYTFLLPGTTCTISDNVDFAPLFLYRCAARPLLIIEKDTLDIGETTTCSTLGFSNEDVTYSCKDPSIARVESDGTITALRAGTTTIQANIYKKYDGYDNPVTFFLEEPLTVSNSYTSVPAVTAIPTNTPTPTMTATPMISPTPTMELIAHCYVYYFDANGSCYSSTFICSINGSTRLPDYKSSLLADNETFIGWKQGNAPIIYETNDSIDYNNILYPDDRVDISGNTYFYPVIVRKKTVPAVTTIPTNTPTPITTATPTIAPTPIADCVIYFFDANSTCYTSTFVCGTNGAITLPNYDTFLLASNETFIGWTQGKAPIIYDTKDNIDYNNILYPGDRVKVPRNLHFYPVIVRKETAPVTTPTCREPRDTDSIPSPTASFTPISTPQVGNNKTHKNSITYAKPKRIKNISWKKSVLHFSKVANVTGYQIKYSRTKNGKGKTITTKSCKKNMKPYHLKGIYYIKIRAYKKLEGTTIYGAWTITKKKF